LQGRDVYFQKTGLDGIPFKAEPKVVVTNIKEKSKKAFKLPFKYTL